MAVLVLERGSVFRSGWTKNSPSVSKKIPRSSKHPFLLNLQFDLQTDPEAEDRRWEIVRYSGPKIEDRRSIPDKLARGAFLGAAATRSREMCICNIIILHRCSFIYAIQCLNTNIIARDTVNPHQILHLTVCEREREGAARRALEELWKHLSLKWAV